MMVSIGNGNVQGICAMLHDVGQRYGYNISEIISKDINYLYKKRITDSIDYYWKPRKYIGLFSIIKWYEPRFRAISKCRQYYKTLLEAK